MKEYKLLSGEMIDLSVLLLEEQEHIGRIKQLVTGSKGIITREDYLEAQRQVFTPMEEGIGLTPAKFNKLRNSPRYKVVTDLLECCYQKYQQGLEKSGIRTSQK